MTGTHRFGYRGWDVRVSLQGVPGQGQVSARADLSDGAQRRHALVLQGAHRHAGAALSALSCQVRAFIDGRRPQHGQVS